MEDRAILAVHGLIETWDTARGDDSRGTQQASVNDRRT
jgi:hypothetical protein